MNTQTLAKMLEANSIPEPNSGCSIWLRGCANGYPVWKWKGRQTRVSHLALSTKGIEVPDGFEGCHRCDNPLCVNADHLFVGTRKDNHQDARAKGRLKRAPKIVCKRGHPLSGDNLRVDPKSGVRICRSCTRMRIREWMRGWRASQRMGRADG
jgi:hypothetical protein